MFQWCWICGYKEFRTFVLERLLHRVVRQKPIIEIYSETCNLGIFFPPKKKKKVTEKRRSYTQTVHSSQHLCEIRQPWMHLPILFLKVIWNVWQKDSSRNLSSISSQRWKTPVTLQRAAVSWLKSTYNSKSVGLYGQRLSSRFQSTLVSLFEINIK